MALINKDTRIARYSAEEGVGWVPLIPGLDTALRVRPQRQRPCRRPSAYPSSEEAKHSP